MTRQPKPSQAEVAQLANEQRRSRTLVGFLATDYDGSAREVLVFRSDPAKTRAQMFKAWIRSSLRLAPLPKNSPVVVLIEHGKAEIVSFSAVYEAPPSPEGGDPIGQPGPPGPEGPPGPPGPGGGVPDATVAADTAVCVETEIRSNLVEHDGDHEYGEPAIFQLYSSVQPNTVWPETDCGIGGGGWGPGRREEEVVYEFELASIPAEWLGLEFRFAGYDTIAPAEYEGNSVGVPRGVADGGRQVFGVYFSEPTDVRAYTPLVRAALSEKYDLFVPRSMLRVGTNYLARGPDWQASDFAFFCGQELASEFQTPGEAGGEGNSGIIQIFNEPCGYPVKIATGGLTPWVPVAGAVDGNNRTFTLIGWTGEGVPQVRVGIVILGAGDFTYDSIAKTITLSQAPAEGLDVRARYVAAAP